MWVIRRVEIGDLMWFHMRERNLPKWNGTKTLWLFAMICRDFYVHNIAPTRRFVVRPKQLTKSLKSLGCWCWGLHCLHQATAKFQPLWLMSFSGCFLGTTHFYLSFPRTPAIQAPSGQWVGCQGQVSGDSLLNSGCWRKTSSARLPLMQILDLCLISLISEISWELPLPT